MWHMCRTPSLPVSYLPVLQIAWVRFCWYWPTLQASDCQVLIAQGVKAVVFGVPDMGKVCTEQHVPSYLNSMNELRSAGVDKLVCLAVSEPTLVQEWAKKAGLQGDKVCSWGTAQQWLCSLPGLVCRVHPFLASVGRIGKLT